MQTAVLHALGWICAVSALAMIIPAGFAVAVDSVGVTQAFLVPIIAIGFIGGSLLMAFGGRILDPTRRDSLILLALVWLAVPLAGALPFYTAGAPASYLDAFFEATSGFTTTGATVFGDLSEVPTSIIVWRAVLQWLGGLTTLLAIAVVLGPLSGIDILDRHIGVRGISAISGTRHLIDAARTLTPIYLALTAACFIGLSLTNLPAFDAFCLALAAVSTGGFTPRSGPIALYGSPAVEAILAVFMLLSAVSIVWVGAIMQRRWTAVRAMREPPLIAAMVLTVGLLMLLAAIERHPDAGAAAIARIAVSALASAASLVSTTGFTFVDAALIPMPYLLLLLLGFIGGGRFSTAGGLKVYRTLAMLRQLVREMQLLLYPHGVRPARYGEAERDSRIVKAIWTAFVAFVSILGLLTVLLSASGLPFAGALMAGTAALSNVGPLYDLALAGEIAGTDGFATMTPAAKLTLCAGMILGRLEIVALISLLSISFWRQ